MASRLYQLLVRHWLRRMTENGRRPHLRAVFLGDYVSAEVVTKGIYEGHQLDVLRDQVFAHLPGTKLCLDVGANIGNHACFFDQHFDRVIAFEPNPPVFSLLQVNAMGRNIEPVPVGLSDAPGTLWFRQNLQNLGGSAIVETEAEADTSIEVMRLDDFVADQGLTDIGFIKIDVEGHEMKMLKGAVKTMERDRPVLAAEGLFQKNPDLGRDIEAFLTEIGYNHFYELQPRHPFARWLGARGYRMGRGLLGIVLPDHIKRTRMLVKTSSIRHKNHALFVAAAAPLSGVSF